MSARLKNSSGSLNCQTSSTQKLLHTIGYNIGKTIGQGTYSKVCVASNRYGHKLACKIIDKRCAGIEFIDKFLPRELEIITSIKHVNIVTVYKILEVNKIIYMFMDYCKHGDLLEYIRNNGPFVEEQAKCIFRQVVDAVCYLHNMDIAHRDLKCENILLMSHNQVKLGDFGFARYCTNDYGEKIYSDTFCGSAAYAAPEILQGVSYDPKGYDIWALGCILYIMISASMPYDDTNIKRMVNAQMSRSIYTLTFLWTEYSCNLRHLVNSLLEPEPEKRVCIDEVMVCPWLQKSALTKLKNLLSVSDNTLF